MLDRLVGLAFCVVCGMFGNAWYLAHAKRQIARTRALGLEESAYYAALARRGGTSFIAAIGIFLLYFALVFAAFVAFEFLDSGV